MPTICIRIALLWAVLLAVLSPAAAQRPLGSIDAQRGVEANPFASAEDIAAGQAHFESRCTSCHGADGRDERGPDLTRSVYRHGNTDRAIFMNLVNGIPGTGMPSIRGVLRNEDAYSILLLDTAGRLRAFSKADLQAIERPAGSLMSAPDFSS